MEDIVRFFWERWLRANQMDGANKVLGRHTHYWIEAEEWLNAYKSTLSKNKLKDFDKIWDKLNKELEIFHNDIKGRAKNPLSVN